MRLDWADGEYNRLPAVMAEVVERKVDVLVTSSTPAAIAAKNTSSTIPIVVAAMGDPVGTGATAMRMINLALGTSQPSPRKEQLFEESLLIAVGTSRGAVACISCLSRAALVWLDPAEPQERP